MQQRITFFDNWNTLEQACLASAVRMFGDHETNWSTVCNHLKTKFSLIERPGNWLTPESCEAQYKWLSDKYVKMEISCERPVNQILQNLKQIGEYESQPVLEQENKYKELKKRVELVANNEVDAEILKEFYEEAYKRNREREENLKKRGLKSDSSNVTKSVKPDNKTDGSSPITTSPLLSSLLNNPPAVQYRPTLSTASFIPNKTTQGTSRTSYERGNTPEAGQRTHSSALSERSSIFSSSASSSARKLDFQDPSTSSSVASHEQVLSSPKEGDTDKTTNNEPVVKSNIHNLENISLIPATEEYLSDAMLLQVIDNLEGKELLDEVLDKLTGDKESIIEKDLNTTVTVPLDDSFVADSSTPKDPVPAVTSPAESKSAAALDSSLTNTEFESLGHQYAATKNVIIIEEEDEGEEGESPNEQVVSGASITDVEQPALTDTVTINADSSMSSLGISVASESVSDTKSDSEPSGEYLDTNAVDKIGLDSVQKSDEAEPATDETRESVGSYESCRSTPTATETPELSLSDEKAVVKTATTEDVEVTLNTEEAAEVEKVKEISKGSETEETTAVCETSLTIQLRDTFDLDVPVNELEQIGKRKKVDTRHAEMENSNESAEDETKVECIDKTEEGSMPESVTALSETISKPILETEQSTLSTLPTITEETVSTASEQNVFDVKVASPSDTNNTGGGKNRRQPARRRKSTVSESSETSKLAKIASEETEGTEEEEKDAKTVSGTREINITIKDFQTADLDLDISNGLLKPKVEPVEEPVVQGAQTSSTKTKTEDEKPANKTTDAKKTKQKASVISRRSSVRTQNQNPSTPKTDEAVASPLTPTSLKTNESDAKKKKSLVLAHQRLATQKYSSAFLKPISNKTVTGYDDVIYSPQDLQTIKRKIDNRTIATVTDFQRDVLLMILNAKMFNRVNSQVYNMAVEMQKEALPHIQLTVQALNEGVLFDMEDVVSEKVRKRQATENVKRDQKPTKRSKTSMKDECTPAKKIKLEENESTS